MLAFVAVIWAQKRTAPYRECLERFSGMKFFQPKVRLSNQNPSVFASVRQTNQIALFLFVCCFCCSRVFILRSYKSHSITFKCLLCRLDHGSPVIFNYIILCLPAYLILLPCSCSYIWNECIKIELNDTVQQFTNIKNWQLHDVTSDHTNNSPGVTIQIHQQYAFYCVFNLC